MVLVAILLAALVLAACAVPNPTRDQRLPEGYSANVQRQYANVPYGYDPRQKIDVYLPNASAWPGRRPVLVYLHSGGWCCGDKTAIPEFIKRQVRRGYVLVSADYRLTEGGGGSPAITSPQNLYDVKRATCWLRDTHPGFPNSRIDRGMIIVAGGSAGGHLAALAGATAGKLDPAGLPGPPGCSRPDGVLPIVAPVALVNWWRDMHPDWKAFAGSLAAPLFGCPLSNPDCNRAKRVEATPATHLSAKIPPAYFINGTQDHLAPWTDGRDLALQWQAARGGDPNSAWYDSVNGAGHNPDHQLNLYWMEAWLDFVVAGYVS